MKNLNVFLLLAALVLAFLPLQGAGPIVSPPAESVTGLGTMSTVNSPAPIANGGTGATASTAALVALGGMKSDASNASDASTVRTNIGLGSTDNVAFANASVSTNLTVGGTASFGTALPISSGGTGAATAADARTALGVYATSTVDAAIDADVATVAGNLAAHVASDTNPNNASFSFLGLSDIKDLASTSGQFLKVVGDSVEWADGGTGSGASTAASISVDVSAFAGNLSAADDTVQKALDTIDDLSLGSGSGLASEVAVATASFDGNLTGDDDTVQKALETLDDLDVSGTQISINQQTATYALVLADAGALVRMSTTSTATADVQTIWVPPLASVAWPIGTQVSFIRSGEGEVRIVGTGGVVLNDVCGASEAWLLQQYSGATAVHIGTDVWDLTGHLKTGY